MSSDTKTADMLQFDKTDKRLLTVQVEEALMRLIRQEPVEIGERIPNEFKLAEMFGVGRSTIREAVKSLVYKGILEVRRGSGTYVAATSSSEHDPLGLSRLRDKSRLALELMEVRLLLEPESAALAAKAATQEQLTRLVSLCDETEYLYVNGEDPMQKDFEFHTWIGGCSGNRVVETLIPVIGQSIAACASLNRRTLMRETTETHRAIVNAILERDPAGARYAMVMHLNHYRQVLVEQCRERQEKRKEQGAIRQEEGMAKMSRGMFWDV